MKNITAYIKSEKDRFENFQNSTNFYSEPESIYFKQSFKILELELNKISIFFFSSDHDIFFAQNHESFDGNSENFASGRMNSGKPTNFTTTPSHQVKPWNVGGKDGKLKLLLFKRTQSIERQRACNPFAAEFKA